MPWVKNGIKPVCKVHKSDERINIQPLFDDDMNLVKKYKVNVYDKNIHEEWILDKQVEGNINHLLIGQKLYSLCGLDVLLPLNMDFNSPSCGRCYEVEVSP
jgi:hypothetical protein